MGKCYEYHATDITVDLIVGIHEGIHFLDLGLDKYEVPPKDSSEIDLSKIEFLLPSLERFPHPTNNLPSVKSVLDRYWKRSDTKNLSDMSYVFLDFYEAYVEDLPMLSSMYLIAGGGTEFNAYTHGVISASHFSSLKGEPISTLSVQRSGMLFFAALFNAYYSQLYFEFGDQFARSMMSGSISNFQKLLFQFAQEALIQSDMCSNIEDTDIKAIRDFFELMNSDAFEKVVGPNTAESFVQSLQCTNL